MDRHVHFVDGVRRRVPSGARARARTHTPAMTALATSTARYEAAITALFARRPEIMLPGLRRIEALCHSLGEPQQAFDAIHLTGTNGKTTTARMITALLVAAGQRVGTYTSPHLEDVRERFGVDGQPLPIADLLAGLDALEPHIDRVERATGEMVTFFEASTALCLWALARARIDTGVIEVGMGGRWDATNVVDAAVAVIGRVTLDHPQLGSTVAEVAWEKAGIIADGATVVSANLEAEPADVIAAEVARRHARLLLLDRDFGVAARRSTPNGQHLDLRAPDGTRHTVDLPLHGAHQATNAACALAAVCAHLGGAPDPAHVRAGFAKVSSPGRLELLATEGAVPVLLDGAHNPAAVGALVRALAEMDRPHRRVLVLGVLDDKDVMAMTRDLAVAVDEVVVTAPQTPRAAAPAHVRAACRAAGLPVVATTDNVPDAMTAAVDRADGNGMVIVTGSLYVVGEARTALRWQAGGL